MQQLKTDDILSIQGPFYFTFNEAGRENTRVPVKPNIRHNHIESYIKKATLLLKGNSLNSLIDKVQNKGGAVWIRMECQT